MLIRQSLESFEKFKVLKFECFKMINDPWSFHM